RPHQSVHGSKWVVCRSMRRTGMRRRARPALRRAWPELVWGFSCQVIFGAFFRPGLAAPRPRSATEGLGSHPQPRAAHTSARAWRGWRAAGLPGSEHRGILGYGRPAVMVVANSGLV